MSMKMDVESFFQQRYYRINKLLLSTLGLWPFQSTLETFLILGLNILVAGSLIIPQICVLMELTDDIDALFECLPPIIIFIMCTTKVITSIYYKPKFQELLKRIMLDWKSFQSVIEEEVFRKYAENGRNMTVLYMCLIYPSGVFFPTVPVLKHLLRNKNTTELEPDELPFRVQYYIDQEKYYYLIVFHGAVSGVIYITVVNAVETLFFVLVEHTCGLFSATGYRLEEVLKNFEKDVSFSSEEENDKVYNTIVYCIKKHQQAIQFADMLESIYTTPFLLLLGSNMIILSITAIQATRDVTSIDTILKYSTYIAAQMTHLFFETWHGQRIMDHSANIRNCAYNGGWQEMSIKCKRLLSIIMIRSSLCSILTAGKFAVMSLETFGAVVRTSVSYYTVLCSFQ